MAFVVTSHLHTCSKLTSMSALGDPQNTFHATNLAILGGVHSPGWRPSVGPSTKFKSSFEGDLRGEFTSGSSFAPL